MNKKNHKKRNTAVFIDSENISSKKASDIMREAKKRGVVDRVNAYGIQKDKSTQSWAKVARETEGMKDIRLYGGPGKNKVDQKIKKDVMNVMKSDSNIDIVVLAASDHGYAPDVEKLRAMGKRVIVIGEEKAPASLRNASSEFVQV